MAKETHLKASMSGVSSTSSITLSKDTHKQLHALMKRLAQLHHVSLIGQSALQKVILAFNTILVSVAGVVRYRGIGFDIWAA